MPPTPADDAVARAFLKDLEAGRKSVPGVFGDAAPLRHMVHPSYNGSGGSENWLRAFLPGSDYDYQVQAGDLWKNSAVAACLRVYKANFPQPQLTVRRKSGKGKDKVVPNHSLVKLINRPNKYYDRFAMWASFVTAALCDGNAYLMKVRSAAGIPVELWWVPPWLLTPLWPSDGSEFIHAYRYRVNGRTFLIRPEDIVHYRHGGPDPRNERVAMSELKAAAARVVCGLNEVDGYTASLMRNMGIVPYIMSPAFEGGRISRDDSETVKDQWRERTTGENRGDLFVNPGAFKVDKLGLSPEEMSLDKIPARLEDQVSALTGVPAMLAGLSSGAEHKTYANYGEARRSFYEDTLIPMQAGVAECLEHNLLNDAGMGNAATEEIAFDYDRVACLREDQDAVWTRAATAYEKGLIMRAEGRDMIGLDWTPEDEAYFVEPGGAGDGSDPGKEGLADETGPDAVKAILEGDDRRPFRAWLGDQVQPEPRLARPVRQRLRRGERGAAQTRLPETP